MEHEVFVPVPADRIRDALADPAAVAAALPGLQLDAGAQPDTGDIAGRLRLRVGGSTITYRGALRLTPRGDRFAVEGEATEARGTGTVKLSLEIGIEPARRQTPGALLAFTGNASADGRITGFEDGVAEAAARRLLDRFVSELAVGLPDLAELVEGPEDEVEDVDELDLVDDLELVDEVDLVEVEVEVPETVAALEDLDPPAEAAHARRTMIGRSAEEVDHAPPRGRYTPVPAPEASSAAETLRWAAPAAAALLASAVIVGRALRRRR